MLIEEQLQQRTDITPLGLQLLRHSQEQNHPAIHVFDIKGIVGAKHFRHVIAGEVSQVVVDSANNTTELISGLTPISAFEVDERPPE